MIKQISSAIHLDKEFLGIKILNLEHFFFLFFKHILIRIF